MSATGFELSAVIEQPIEIEESLVDHVLVDGALVFKDDRAAILINPERVDPLQEQLKERLDEHGGTDT